MPRGRGAPKPDQDAGHTTEEERHCAEYRTHAGLDYVFGDDEGSAITAAEGDRG